MLVNPSLGEHGCRGWVDKRCHPVRAGVRANAALRFGRGQNVDEFEHLPVLLDEVIAALKVKSDGIYIDATYGRGGHVAAILDRLGPRGRVLALDRDPQAVSAAETRFSSDRRFSVTRAPFSRIGHYIDSSRLTGKINGILFDLGVSSPQLDDFGRGFSFQRTGPLDMRMDPDTGVPAAQWINSARESEIASVLKNLGEERYAKRIAHRIIHERKKRAIETSSELADVVAKAVPTREPGKHPATRTFLAIRLFVNAELEELRAALPQALNVLAPGGRLAVISFHSLEDRLVKHFMREQARGDGLPPGLPVRQQELKPRLKLVGKPVRASETEVKRNPRARSALLRVAERIEEDRA